MYSREPSGKVIWPADAPRPAIPGATAPEPLKTTVFPPKVMVTEGVEPICPVKKFGATYGTRVRVTARAVAPGVEKVRVSVNWKAAACWSVSVSKT